MTRIAFEKIAEGLQEAAAVARGEAPAAAIWHDGFRYVPDPTIRRAKRPTPADYSDDVSGKSFATLNRLVQAETEDESFAVAAGPAW